MKKIALLASVLLVALSLAGYGLYVSAADKAAEKTGGKEAVSKAAPAAKKDAAPKPGNNQNAAVVNGKPIPMAEYQAEVARFDRRMEMMGEAEDEVATAEMKKSIIDTMIAREILQQEAAKLGIKAEDAELDAQMQALKARFGSGDEFKNTIGKMNLTEQNLRDQFASEMVMRKLVEQEIASKVKVSKEDTKAFYDKHPEIFKSPEMVRASHILVKLEEKPTPEDKAKALEKIKGIQKRIKDGADFAEVAKEVSDDPGSKENGGDLDFFQQGQMVPSFEKAAFALKPSELSDVVETEYGFHLIKLTEKKEAGVISFDEMQPRIEQHLKNEGISQQLAQHIEKLKTTAKIEIFVQ
ncbi:MAG: peptidylprolyl isomerase [Syntrophobacteraceae bacterium]